MGPQPVQPNRIPTWVWIVIPLTLLVLCCGGVGAVVKAMGSDTPSTPTAANVEQTVDAADYTPEPPAPPAREGVDVDGNSAAVKQLGVTLNGMYQIDYTGSSNCIIVEFKKADGTIGASGILPMINDCAASSGINGSTLMKLNDTSMIQVSNTRGAWSVKFVPVG